MTTTPQNRVRPGVPSGGEYAATVHAEPGITLGQPVPAFPAWPTSLPEPVVKVHLDEKGRPVTTLTTGELQIEVESDLPDGHSSNAGPIDDDMDDETLDAALDYAYEIQYRVDAAFLAEREETLARVTARVLREAAGPGQGPRPENAVLESPLTPYEIGARVDEHGYVTGLAEFEMSDLVDRSLDSHLDDLSDRLVGSPLLMDVSGGPVEVTRGGVIVMELRGQADEIIAGFDEDELEQFEAGRASQAGGAR